MITTFDNKDIARKQPHRVILDPLMHLRVKGLFFYDWRESVQCSCIYVLLWTDFLSWAKNGAEFSDYITFLTL